MSERAPPDGWRQDRKGARVGRDTQSMDGLGMLPAAPFSRSAKTCRSRRLRTLCSRRHRAAERLEVRPVRPGSVAELRTTTGLCARAWRAPSRSNKANVPRHNGCGSASGGVESSNPPRWPMRWHVRPYRGAAMTGQTLASALPCLRRRSSFKEKHRLHHTVSVPCRRATLFFFCRDFQGQSFLPVENVVAHRLEPPSDNRPADPIFRDIDQAAYCGLSSSGAG